MYKPTMAPLTITVTGTAHTLRPATRAILVLKASTPELSTAARASATITYTAKQIRDAIEPHCPSDPDTGRIVDGAGVSHYSMGSLDTSSARRSVDKYNTEYETVHTASTSFNIKFADFALLNRLATQLSALEAVEIQRIEWHLTDAQELSIHSEARRNAAADAVQRAYDYAAVFAGVKEGDLKRRVRAIKVEEDGNYRLGTGPQLHSTKTKLRGNEDFKREELRFVPEDVRLSVCVEGVFVVEE
jgi:hypothetical protein